jgi:prophage regulatory protein
MHNIVTDDLQQLRIVRRAEVLHLTGLSRASLYRLIAQSLFPTPVRLGSNSVGWKEAQVRGTLPLRAAGFEPGALSTRMHAGMPVP